MGDRGNIAIVDQGQRVYLYTHWHGSEIKAITKQALARKQRWGDAPYLARIVFQTMLAGDDGETGFGISTCIGDNEYPVVVIDCDAQAVHLEGENGQIEGESVSFADYIK